MKRAECVGLVITLIFAGICAALLLYVLIEGPENYNKAQNSFITSYVGILYTVMYIIVIVELNRVMAKIPGELQKEKRSVNC